MSTNFTSKQKEIIARKLGYDGPMQGFDEFIASSPALQAKYNAVTQKYVEKMAKGGFVKKYARGGFGQRGPAVIEDGVDYEPALRSYASAVEPAAPTPAARAPAPAPAPAPAAPAPTPAAPTPAAPTPAAPAPTASTPTASTPSGAGTPSASDMLKMIVGRLPNPNNYTMVDATNALKAEENSAGTGGGPGVDAGAGAGVDAGAGAGVDAGAGAGANSIDTTKISIKNPTQAADELGGAPSIPDVPKYEAATTDTSGLGAKAVTAGGVSNAFVRNATKAGDIRATDIDADAYSASTSQKAIEEAQKSQTAATGTVSDKAQVTAQQGAVSKDAVAQAQTVGEQYIKPVTAEKRETQAGELVTAQTQYQPISVGTAQAAAPTAVQAATRGVTEQELVKAAQIKEEDMAQAEAITASGLAPDAVVVAARLEKFTVDDGTLAEAIQGNVDAQSTVQGQLSELMKSFDDGKTPAWAAGAIRAANAAMASRGLGGSSMAGAAIFQAAMESALPIAQQDAQTFAQMGLQNLNNRQQVALSNAAAQQGLQLQNLSNEQQARLQNAANSFSLQSQNLSNMQQTMLANTQIRATLQGKNLDNQQQSAVVNAARYAEQANINLNNIQQAALHNSSMQVQVDIANASNKQQSMLAEAQIKAAMEGKVLDNKQQAAVLNAATISENLNTTFKSAEMAALQNSQLMKDVGIANLNAAQQTVIANAATYAAMDMANLNNRQQAAVVNAQNFLQMDLKNLDNQQQMSVIKSQQIAQSILSDTAAENAAKATNATNKLEADKISATLELTAKQFNASESNKINLANANAANELAKFNAQEKNDRDEFNAAMSNQINIANSKILADVSTANTAAINAANALNAKNATELTTAVYNQLSTTYRDKLEMSFKAADNDANRATEIVKTTISAEATKATANKAADASSSKAIGELVGKVVTSDKFLSWIGL